MKSVMLLSYPRSGNTWIRYCVEVLTKCPTCWPGSTNHGDKPICEVIKDIEIDKSKPSIMVKAHRLKKEYVDCQPLLLVIRNYKEVIPRHLGAGKKLSMAGFKGKFDNATKGIGNNGVDYIGCIQSYEMCSKEKMVVFYEDLIKKPRPTITSIIEFMKQDTSGIEEFFKKYDWHVKRGILAYHDKSYTKGKKVLQHSNRLDKDLREYMDQRIQEKFPKLFDNYLKRYKE